MQLKEILSSSQEISKGEIDKIPAIDISGIAYDSREVKKGNLFVAIEGEYFDGHDYIQAAIDNGAVAVVGEKDYSVSDEVVYFKSR